MLSLLVSVDPPVSRLAATRSVTPWDQGHALFAKFLTDTEVAQASVDYYKQPH